MLENSIITDRILPPRYNAMYIYARVKKWRPDVIFSYKSLPMNAIKTTPPVNYTRTWDGRDYNRIRAKHALEDGVKRVLASRARALYSNSRRATGYRILPVDPDLYAKSQYSDREKRDDALRMSTFTGTSLKSRHKKIHEIEPERYKTAQDIYVVYLLTRKPRVKTTSKYDDTRKWESKYRNSRRRYNSYANNRRYDTKNYDKKKVHRYDRHTKLVLSFIFSTRSQITETLFILSTKRVINIYHTNIS